MRKFLNILAVCVLIILLVLIRAFQDDLFYDPLIVYFKNDYLYTKIPEIDTFKFFVNILYRYTLNTLISLAIIWVLFQKKTYLKFSIKFFGLAFLILSVVLMFFVITEFKNGYLFPFYVRRFLIHPLFLFLLIPAFYYQKRLR